MREVPARPPAFIISIHRFREFTLLPDDCQLDDGLWLPTYHVSSGEAQYDRLEAVRKGRVSWVRGEGAGQGRAILGDNF